MQDAFASEANAVGTWERIGYKMDDTMNFDYIEASPTSANDGTAAITASASLGKTWSAKNKVAMNDCTVSSGTGSCEWSLTMTGDAKGNGVSYAAGISSAAKMLTPSFQNLAR